MRLLVITDSYPPYHSGGYELRCKDVIDQLIRRGHEIEIVTTRIKDHGQSYQNHESNIHRKLYTEDNSKNILFRIFTDYLDIRFVNERIKIFQPDIIYLWHIINFTRTIFPFLADIPIPIVYDEGGKGLVWAWEHHGPWFNIIEGRSGDRSKRAIKKLLAGIINILSHNLIKKEWHWPKIYAYFNSEQNVGTVKRLNVPLEKELIIYSGINTSIFEYRTRNGLNFPLNIITPGRVTPQKGIKDSILLAKYLNIHNIPVRLKIVGKVDSQLYFEELEQEIRLNYLNRNIEFLPMANQEEMACLYHDSDICFFPSYQHFGLSRVPLEAMACGSLILTYGNEGSNEVITDGMTGIIIPEGHIAEAASRIEELIKNPKQWMRIIECARVDIEQRYSMDAYIKSIETFLFECMTDEK